MSQYETQSEIVASSVPRTDSGVSILTTIQEEYVLEDILEYDDSEYDIETDINNDDLMAWYESYCENFDEREYYDNKTYYEDECDEF